MIALRHRIFEPGDRLVLEHVFFGKTREEADGIFEAHMKYDEFLRAAVTLGRFRGMPVRSEYKYEEVV